MLFHNIDLFFIKFNEKTMKYVYNIFVSVATEWQQKIEYPMFY